MKYLLLIIAMLLLYLTAQARPINNTIDYPTMIKMVKKSFKSTGWKNNRETRKYAADAPFSTQFALQKNDTFAIIQIISHPNLKTHCKKTMPIIKCLNHPAIKSYTIHVRFSSN